MAGRFDADEGSLLVRTDFSDDEAWKRLLLDVARPHGPDRFTANFVPIDDKTYEGMTAAQLAAVDGEAHVIYAADSLSMVGGDRSLLVVDRLHDPGRSFRCSLQAAWAVENNLSLFNMDFFEFADAAVGDGVFRGC